MTFPRQKFSSKADRGLLREMRKVARAEGRQFQVVLEDAMRDYIARRRDEAPREAVMAHFRTSVEKNRRFAGCAGTAQALKSPESRSVAGS